VVQRYEGIEQSLSSIEVLGEASPELIDRFQAFCEAHGEKADRTGRFLRMMEARVQYCRTEAARLQDRARCCDRKVTQTKNMVLFHIKTRDLKKIEGSEFTPRIQKNSQDPVRFTDESLVPMCLRKVEASFDGQLWEKIIAAVPGELKHMLIASIREAVPSNEANQAGRPKRCSGPGSRGLPR